MENQPIVDMRNIHKRYGEVVALRGVNFKVYPNEIVGLVGDNGAGKSTLIKILAGFLQPDKGEIYFRGKKVKIRSPRDAQRLGIETLYQDQALAPQLTIPRNIFMGREITNRFGFMKMREMAKISKRLLNQIGISINDIEHRPVATLSGGQRQAVAMARSLYFTAKIFTLDEPTAGLSLREVESVLEYVKFLKSKGASVIFVTHNLFHTFPVADRFVVLSAGKVIYEARKEETSIEELSEKIKA